MTSPPSSPAAFRPIPSRKTSQRTENSPGNLRHTNFFHNFNAPKTLNPVAPHCKSPMKPPIPHLSPLLSTALTLCVTVFANGEKYDYTAKNFSLLPPAPTVQHFFDFKDYPVNNFTGIPTISLPLYTIKHGGIEIPITLSYHGGGIRTNQKSGNAGLGWTISCGAEIAHNVCGAPDDASGKVHGLFHLNEDEKLFRNKLIEKNADYDPTDGDHYVNNFAWQAIQGNRYYEGLSDVGTDTYSLTGLGLELSFGVIELPIRKTVRN